MDREFDKLKRFDSADIELVLAKLEKSFNIKFDYEALGDVNSFRMLSDVIIDQINLQHEDTCTTQHAFYVLRNAIAAATGTDKCSITPRSRLAKLLLQENRLKTISDIEQELGFKINLLQPKQWIIGTFSLAFIASLIGLYFNWQLGLAGCLASVLGHRLAGKFGKEIHLKTVGDLANKMARESYLKARRNNTVNKNETEQKVRELFAAELELKPVMITRQSRF